MANDPDVNVKFSAQIGELKSGIEEAKRSLQSITEPISGIMDSFKGLGEALIAALAVEKVAEFMDKFAEMGEQIERTSKLTGLSTDEVQRFQFAVKMTGGDAESAGTSLLLLERNMAQAQNGSGRAYEAFKNMGVTLEDLKTKSPNDILLIMANRFQAAGEGAQQAAIKIDYMRTVAGRAGTSLIPVLNEGAAGLKELNDQLDETGAKMSREEVNDADELTHSIKLLSASWQGLKNTIADLVEPAFKLIVDSLAKITQMINGAIQAVERLGNALLTIPRAVASLTGLSKLQEISRNMEALKKNSAEIAAGSNPLPNLPVGGAGKEDNSAEQTQIAIERNDLQTSLELIKLKLAAQKDADAEAVASGRMSKLQELADLKNLTQQEMQATLTAIDSEMARWDEDSAQYHETKRSDGTGSGGRIQKSLRCHKANLRSDGGWHPARHPDLASGDDTAGG
jgi:hypothetical protein